MTWQRLSEQNEAYYVGLYYHLAKLRRLHYRELIAALRVAAPASLELNRWTRIVEYRYSTEALSAAGSLVMGGRFNIGRDLDPLVFPAFPALYFAEDFETAYREKFGGPSRVFSKKAFTGTEFALRRPGSFTSVELVGQVAALFDLTTTGALRPLADVIGRFETSADLAALAKRLGIKPPWLVTTPGNLRRTLLMPAWRGMPAQFEIPANSQVFGRLLIEAGFEGVLYPSVRGIGRCIAVFPECLSGSESFVDLADSAPAGVEISRLDSATWRRLV